MDYDAEWAVGIAIVVVTGVALVSVLESKKAISKRLAKEEKEERSAKKKKKKVKRTP